MDKVKKKSCLVLVLILFVFLLDVISKLVVMNFLDFGKSVSIIHNFFSFSLVKNDGVAFSMLDGMGLLIIVFTLFAIYFLVSNIKKGKKSNFELISYSFVIGGALGNLFDRVFYGYVIDFLDFNIFGYDFPVFNFADVFIVVGIFCILFFEIKEDRNNGVSGKRKIKS